MSCEKCVKKYNVWFWIVFIFFPLPALIWIVSLCAKTDGDVPFGSFLVMLIVGVVMTVILAKIEDKKKAVNRYQYRCKTHKK